MNKKRINTTGLFLVILFACLSFSSLFAQTEEEDLENAKAYLENVKDYMESVSDQKIPADFFLMTSIFAVSPDFTQEKQKDIKESYIGRWYGNVTTQNIQRAGITGPSGFHETSKDIWWLNFDVKFLHPLDVPSAIEEYKKRGYPAEYIKSLKNLKPVDELKIIGYVSLSGLEKYTHETREYCEECAGKDGTIVRNFPRVRIDVSGRVDLIENKINFHFENVPKKYQVGLGLDHENIKLVSPDMIEVNYKYFKESEEYITDQKVTGKLYRIHTKKDTLGKTVFDDDPIKTDKFTQNDIVIPDVGEVKVKPESECEFKSENEIELFKGKIRNKIKNLGEDALKIRSPQAVIAVRGTDFIINVVKDTTTLRVLEGQVELSDVNHNKTVVVKQNQMSTVKAGGVPSEPVEIGTITKWGELH